MPFSFSSMSLNSGYLNRLAGWIPSLINWDMCSGNLWNAVNIDMNRIFADFQARQMLYSFPTHSFDNFMPYSYVGNSIFQTLPMPTQEQMDQLLSGNGNSLNPFGMGGMGGLGGFGGVGGFGGFGTMPGASGSSSSSSSSSDLTAEQSIAQGKYNKLLAMFDVMEKNNFFGDKNSELYRKIDTARKAAKKEKDPTKQYEILKNAYEENIDKDKLKQEMIKASLATSNSDEHKKIVNLLRSAGYENALTRDDHIRDAASPLVDYINEVTVASGAPESLTYFGNITGNASDLKNIQVLDFLSYWNTTYKENDKHSIVKFLGKKYVELDKADKNNKTNRDKIYDLISKNLVKELCKKADSVVYSGKDILDNEAIEKIKTLSKDLDTLIGTEPKKRNDSFFSKLSDKFESLYVALRIADTKIVEEKVKEYYGFLDEETDKKVFEDLFMSNTLEDLEKEGLKKKADEAAEGIVTYSAPAQPTDETPSADEATDTETEEVETEDPEIDAGSAADDVAAKQKAESKDIGNRLYKLIQGRTDKNDSVKIDSIMEEEVNADNILQVIKQVNKRELWDFVNFQQHPWESSHKFFRFMLTQGGENSLDVAQKALGYVIEHAENAKANADESTQKHLNTLIRQLESYIGEDYGNLSTRRDAKALDKAVLELMKLLGE